MTSVYININRIYVCICARTHTRTCVSVCVCICALKILYITFLHTFPALEHVLACCIVNDQLNI